MAELETYEWVNFWWEHGNDRSAKPRALCIGDSIARSYTPHVNRLLQSGIYVDMLASSRALDNPDYFSELNYMLDRGYAYRLIHLNHGLHGWHVSSDLYAEGIERALDLIRQKYPLTSIVLALSTPVYQQPAFMLDTEKHVIIQSRNQCLRRIAQTRGLAVNDLYSLVLGQKDFFVPDGVHFTEKGEECQARSVANLIRQYSELT